MKQVEPEVFLVARPQVDYDGVAAYLREVGGHRWLERLDRGQPGDEPRRPPPGAPDPPRFPGKMGYRPREPRPDPQVWRGRAPPGTDPGQHLPRAHTAQ